MKTRISDTDQFGSALIIRSFSMFNLIVRSRFARLMRAAGVSTIVLGVTSGLSLVAHAQAPAGSFVQVQSAHNFTGTIAALKRSVAANHMMVLGTMNQAMQLSMAGMHLAGAQSFFIGNPVVGKKAFSMDAAAGVVLPVRIYVWSDHGKTFLGYLKPSVTMSAVDPKFAMPAAMLDKTFSSITDQAAH
ncbi:MAG: DUF302 domain-containing protein [Acidiphilium sp.]